MRWPAGCWSVTAVSCYQCEGLKWQSPLCHRSYNSFPLPHLPPPPLLALVFSISHALPPLRFFVLCCSSFLLYCLQPLQLHTYHINISSLRVVGLRLYETTSTNRQTHFSERLDILLSSFVAPKVDILNEQSGNIPAVLVATKRYFKAKQDLLLTLTNITRPSVQKQRYLNIIPCFQKQYNVQ